MDEKFSFGKIKDKITDKDTYIALKNKLTDKETYVEIKDKLTDKQTYIEIGNDVKKLGKVRYSFHDWLLNMQKSGKLMVSTVIFAVILMLFFCCVVFFINIKGPEKVMVPEVKGKELTTALLEMQAKELYPKIQLRYSDIPGDAGLILEQHPSAGSIVKGYSRVTLVVSRGVVMDHVENYVGQKLDDVRMRLQTLFAGTARPLVILAAPEYKPDSADAGIILAQDPPEGTNISEPVTVHFVVSRGPNFENTRIPNLVGSSVNDVLQQIARCKLVFDFTSHTASGDEIPGTVVSQQTFDSQYVRNYTRVSVDIAMPKGAVSGNEYGLFTDKLPEYPYPVAVKLEAVPPEGEPYTLAGFSHPGGDISIPYAVPKDTVLVLTVVDKEHKKITVR